MKGKVLCAILVYNGRTYREGDYIEVESDEELQIMIRERCAVIEKGIKDPVEKRHYVPSGDEIEEILTPGDKKKAGRRS